MKLSVAYDDPRVAAQGSEAQLAGAVTNAVRGAGAELKDDLRQQILAAGLGSRLANTVRSRDYPSGSSTALDAAVLVWTKAPKVVDAFDRGVTITPIGGQRYLAIPTANVPRKAGGGRARAGLMTPLDVETSFNQDLIIRKGRAGHLLAFVNAVQGAGGRGFKPATRGRLRGGRRPQLVLMFTLVPSVRLPKRLDWAAAGRAAGASISGRLAAGLQGAR